MPGYEPRTAICRRPHERDRTQSRLSARDHCRPRVNPSGTSRLMYRNRHLRAADTKAFDRVRATANCNTTDPEPVFECESSGRRRRSKIDRELVLALHRLDRLHGRLFAWQASHGVPPRDGPCWSCLFNVRAILMRISNIVVTAGTPSPVRRCEPNPIDFRNFLTRLGMSDRRRFSRHTFSAHSAPLFD